ncbi:hypothetical protein V9T40_012900 [Parthenolecanium corni]|uniref:Uncharacterized protein n=1 Tax=Parthenolecanium corni TaxID=536013 RepID=A0AAN9TBS1_9HEMI
MKSIQRTPEKTHIRLVTKKKDPCHALQKPSSPTIMGAWETIQSVSSLPRDSVGGGTYGHTSKEKCAETRRRKRKQMGDVGNERTSYSKMFVD